MIPRPAQVLAFAVLLAGTLQVMTLLGEHGTSLWRDGDHRIACLELAPTSSAAKAIIDDWEGHLRGLRDLALADIRLDYVFIALYATTLSFTGFFGAVVLTGWLARLGPLIGYAMWIAGLCDVLENLGMTQELHGRTSIAPLVFAVSSIKWILVFVGGLYGVVTLVAMIPRWRLLFDQRGPT